MCPVTQWQWSLLAWQWSLWSLIRNTCWKHVGYGGYRGVVWRARAERGSNSQWQMAVPADDAACATGAFSGCAILATLASPVYNPLILFSLQRQCWPCLRTASRRCFQVSNCNKYGFGFNAYHFAPVRINKVLNQFTNRFDVVNSYLILTVLFMLAWNTTGSSARVATFGSSPGL